MMDDALRPTKAAYSQVACKSHRLWSSHLSLTRPTDRLPFDCINLKQLIQRTPAFLGSGLLPEGTQAPFSFIEKHNKSSNLLLGVQSPLMVQVSEHAPLAEWPGIEGLSGYDEGNYLAILFIAWAHILSARWAELLRDCSGHLCSSKFTGRACPPVTAPDQQYNIEVDLGGDVGCDEASWWKVILSSEECWEITTNYNGKTYLSPWSALLAGEARFTITGCPSITSTEPPSSSTALKYLARFCSYHHLHVPKPLPRPCEPNTSCLSQYQSSPVSEHEEHIAHYMTLSSNVWGMRSLLRSTFYNMDIECNLVDAWINPAFAILNPIIQEGNLSMLAKVLTRQQPRLGSLWLGVILIGRARFTLREIEIGLTATNLTAAAWTGIPQSFITSKPEACNGENIRREDECRLLFITGCDGHTRFPIWPWKPFGETRLCDAELLVQQHALCGCHCLDYASWNWSLAHGEELEDSCLGTTLPACDDLDMNEPEQPISVPEQYDYDDDAESLSENATRGIFGWLRLTGYPADEQAIYQHSWIDIESSDDEAVDDGESDTFDKTDTRESIEEWLNALV
ncbi:hypothetical protein BO78DRAFT_463756 [Aspergillus sclerotiicarbonarius CBS 121057]|uniref:Uncharacterized protein n=1 Tax=Aspergillus sclerotiicarbonarius (strain CBS 121057 / IBT 28362) TaxID=1448318 RepID=A0A319DY98_ASPSB|nr:hypothetical protein BO78DRAFT_463756 [Aspergillus sclerotiicarbonarius CBS 121057]